MKRSALFRWIPFRFAALVLTLNAAWPQQAQAASLTWDGNGNVIPNPDGGTGDWDSNTSLNWWDGANNVVWPIPGGLDDDAIFGNNAGTVSIAVGGVTANDLTFNTTNYLIQNNTLTLNGTTPTITAGTGISATISSIISGAAGLAKAGDGTLILTGVNNYTGNTTLSAGTLQLGNAAVNGTVTSGLYNTSAGTTLHLNNFTATPAPTGGWASRVRGAGTLRLTSAQVSGANWGTDSAAALPFDAGFTGTLQLDNGRIDASPAGLGGITNMVFNSGSQFLAWNGTYSQPFSIAGDGWGEAGQPGALRVAGGNNATFNGNITLTGNAGFNSQDGGSTMTINGAISGGAFNIAKHNAGLLVLTGANTYTGTTTVNAGTLRFANTQSLYNSNAGSWTDTNLVVNSGSTAAFNVGGAGEFTSGNMDTLKALGTATGGFRTGSSIGLDTTNAGGSFTYGSVIANPNAGANVLGLAKLGTGTLVLTGANTYTGPTSIGGGILEISGAGSLGSGAYGGIISGAGALVKSSAGTQTLTGANTYTGGTTISAGTLELGDGTIQPTIVGNYNIQPSGTLRVRYNTPTGAVAQTWTRYTGAGTLTLATGKVNDSGWGSVALPYNYNGTVRVEGGRISTLAANASNGMGFGGTQNVIVTPGGHVGMWEGGNFNQNYTISGTGYGELNYESALRFGNGGATTMLNGTVTMAGNTTLAASGGIGIISQGLGENTVSNLIIGTTLQAGAVKLRGANTYTGTTAVNFGTLELSGAGTLGAGGNYTPTLSLAAATTFRFASSSAQTLSGIISGAGTLVADGPGALTLSATNAQTGVTTVGGGTLVLNYGTNDTTKLANGAVLNLNGGIVTLAGASGSHTEAVLSTSLGGGTTLNRSGANTARLALGAITRNAGGALEVAAAGLATTTSPNVNGVLPGVSLAGGLAMNDGATNIVAYSGAYADVNRLGGSIVTGATNHTRIIEAGASGNITLGGAGTNTIATLSNTSTGGLATVDVATTRILRLGAAGSILSPTASGGLTISGAGTLTAGGADNTAGDLLVLNQSASATTISTIIAQNGTGAVSLTKSGSGPLSLTGVNTFGGGVRLNEGTLTARVNVGQTALGTGAVAVSGGSTLVLNNVSTATGPVNISNVFSGAGNIQLLFADGITSPRNTILNGTTPLLNFTGGIRLSLASGATATGDKWTASGITTPASLTIDPGTQMYWATAANINGGITVSGIGNSEGRGAIRLANTLGGNITLAGDASVGPENGTIAGNITSGAAGTQTLTFGTANSTTGATVNGIIGGGTGTIAIVKNQAAAASVLTLRAPNTYTGGTTINAGIVSVGSGGTGVPTASVSALGTGGVTVNTGGTLRLWIKNDAAFTIGNNLTVNGGTLRNEDGNHTLSGTVFVDTAGATLTSVFAGKNLTLSNVVSGPGNVTANAGASQVILTAANTYGGATVVNSGTLSLSGAGGAILNSTGVTVNAGTFLLDNTAAANSGNRVANALPVTMNGGTFNFAHTAGAANYSETAGALTLGGAGTVAASQAASGQTSALTLASLTRNAGAGVNFTGTGLGADTRNRILFTAAPVLSDGIIGPWATINGNLATYDNTLGVREFTTFTDLVRLTGSKVITDAPGTHVRIIEGTGAAANLTLGSAVTTVSTITQSATGGASAGTIDLAGQTLRLGVNGGVTAQTGSGALTVGLVGTPGILTAGGADNTAGRISFINPTANTTVVNSAITNNGTGAVSVESVSGNLTFGGGTANTFNGTLDIGTAGSANSRSVVFAKTGGVTAIGNNAVVNFGLGTTGEANLRMSASGQFGSNVLMNFQNPNGAWARVDLMGTNQALAGITTPSLSATQHGAVIQNRELGNTIATYATSTLTLDGSGTYQYNGYIRNADTVAAVGTNLMAIAKSGSGTQTLAGNQIIYTGATTLSNGTLALQDTTLFASPITVSGTGTLNSIRTVQGFAGRSTILGTSISGTGILNINNSGSGLAGGWTTVGVANGLTMAGTINVNTGTLSRDQTTVSNINTTAAVTVAAGAAFGAGRGGNSTIGGLNGAGDVGTFWAAANAGSITIGNGDGNGNFSGVLRGNGTNATDGTLEGGVLSVIKMGLGTQILTGANTYSGTTSVNGGILQIGNGGATGNLGTGATTVAAGATLDYRRTGLVIQPGALNSAAGAGTLAINGDATTAVVLNAGGNFSGIVNVNAGALVAGATNPWNTALTAPTFNIAAGAALAAGPTSNHAHIGALNLSGGTVSTAPSGVGSYDTENFQLNGDVTVTGTVASTITRDIARTNADSGISLRGVRTFTVGNVTSSPAVDLFVSTELENTDAATITAAGVGGIIKAGAGTMSLAGTHSYTGITTVNAGTLHLEVGSSIAASSLLTVNGTATLSGSGATGPVAFTAGSSVRPGSSPGILNTGSATSSADVFIEIGGATAGNGSGFHDQINTTGTLTLNGGLLAVSLIDGYVPAQNALFDIWLNDDVDAIAGSGTFTGMPEGFGDSATWPVPETATAEDYWTITYLGSTGNDIRLVYVPEPSSSMLGGAAVLVALSRRRRRTV